MTGSNLTSRPIGAHHISSVRVLNHLMKAAVASALVFTLVLGIVGASHAQSFSVSYSNKEFVAASGERFSGVIDVSNISEDKLELSISLQDYVRVDGGKGVYNTAEPGTEEKSLCSWMTFSPDQMVLEPGETGIVNYQVDLPEDTEMEGSYWGVLLVKRAPTEESIAERIETATSSDTPSIGINVVFEYIIVVYLTIEGTEKREAIFSAIRFDEPNGQVIAVATFDNLGNVYVKPEVWLELTDLTGQVVYKSEPQKRVVLPESEREFSFSLKHANVSPGEYLLMVIADYDVPQLIAAQARVKLTEQESGGAPPAGDADGGGEAAPAPEDEPDDDGSA